MPEASFLEYFAARLPCVVRVRRCPVEDGPPAYVDWSIADYSDVEAFAGQEFNAWEVLCNH